MAGITSANRSEQVIACGAKPHWRNGQEEDDSCYSNFHRLPQSTKYARS
jgi:hypothetical protein